MSGIKSPKAHLIRHELMGPCCGEWSSSLCHDILPAALDSRSCYLHRQWVRLECHSTHFRRRLDRHSRGSTTATNVGTDATEAPRADATNDHNGAAVADYFSSTRGFTANGGGNDDSIAGSASEL